MYLFLTFGDNNSVKYSNSVLTSHNLHVNKDWKWLAESKFLLFYISFVSRLWRLDKICFFIWAFSRSQFCLYRWKCFVLIPTQSKQYICHALCTALVSGFTKCERNPTRYTTSKWHIAKIKFNEKIPKRMFQ